MPENSPPNIPPETQLFVTQAVGAAKDEFRNGIDSMRVETKAHTTRLAITLAILTSILGVLTFFGFKETVSRAIDKKLEDLGIAKLEERAEHAASRAENHATTALDKAKKTDEINRQAEDLLTALRQRQAASTGFTSVTSRATSLNTVLTGAADSSLPDAIPKTATEILVFCYAKSGASAKTDGGFIDVSTIDANNRITTLSLYVRTYENQQALAFNSDYFWLPYPTNRTVAAKWNGFVPTKNTDGYVQIVGYR